MLASPGSKQQWRALKVADWLLRQPDCAPRLAARLAAFARCQDRSLRLAAALLIRHLAEACSSVRYTSTTFVSLCHLCSKSFSLLASL